MTRIRSAWCLVLVVLCASGSWADNPDLMDCKDNPLDIMFYLDTSGSVGAQNFRTMLTFVSSFVDAFKIGAQNVQAGVVIFDSVVIPKIKLNQFHDKQQLKKAITQIKFHGGGTSTDRALAHARNTGFTAANGGRPKVTQVAVVVTDGRSGNKGLTKQEADKLHQTNIQVFSIGIGGNVDKSELNFIASKPDMVSTVGNFNDLKKIQKKLQTQTCKAKRQYDNWGPWSTCTVSCGSGVSKRTRKCLLPKCYANSEESKTCNAQVCPTVIDCKENPLDIMFLVDASGSVNPTNFKKELQFVSSFVDSFDISAKHVQVGVVSFDGRVSPRIKLNQIRDKNTLKQAINNIRFTGGGTATDIALRYIRTQGFTPQNGGRTNVTQVLVVVTDGQSANTVQTKREADAIHKTNIQVFSIGIGNGVNRAELNAIASTPDMVSTVGNFNELKKIQDKLHTQTCTAKRQFGDWGAWTPCTASCNSGERSRTRKCLLKKCYGGTDQKEACNTQSCPTVPPTTEAPKCNYSIADVVFALDGSSSVGQANFNRMLTFVDAITKSFEVGKDSVHVGLVTFADHAKLRFHMNKYFNMSDILTQIKKIPYQGGSTNTGEALNYLRTTSFLPQNGARANVPKIAIIITDGRSNVPVTTAQEAAALKKDGVIVFSIGVGSKVYPTELEQIASATAKNHVFLVNNFEALNNIRKAVAFRACEAQKNATEPPVVIEKCPAQADIIFILDSSASIGKNNFQKILSFVTAVCSRLTIGPDQVKIGVDSFDSHSRTEFGLNSYNDTLSVLVAVNRIRYRGGSTHTGEGIQRVFNESVSFRSDFRPNVTRIAILVTDGESNGPLNVENEAKRLKNDGVLLFTVGIGAALNEKLLTNVASTPARDFEFRAEDFDVLSSIAARLSKSSCNLAPLENSTVSECYATADIVFVLDSSASVGYKNFHKILAFVEKLVDKFEIGPKHMQIGALSFNSRPHLEFHLNKFHSKQDIKKAISTIRYTIGNTFTDQAINFMHYHMFTHANGARTNVPKIGVIITDGESTLPDDTKLEAANARKSNITLISIGIGSSISRKELNEIASDPDNEHVFNSKDFNNLLHIVDTVANKTCVSIPKDVKPKECRDTIPNCRYFGEGACNAYPNWSVDYCTKYCDMCEYTGCRDKFTTCAEEAKKGMCEESPVWARDYCMRSCNVCKHPGNKTISQQVGYCVYKGKAYNQGETWVDGCELECSCLDSHTGVFSCWNKCPIYHNLPPMCTLVKVEGECCKKPICNFNGKHSVTTGHAKSKIHGIDVCLYKGHQYYEGQTWQDGCDFNCKCEDASSGFWRCDSRCPKYTGLPADCYLMKRAGKCCDEVVCPFNTHFGRFKGSGKIVAVRHPPTEGPCVDKVDCTSLGAGVCTLPDLKSWAAMNCRKTCGTCSTAKTPLRGSCLVSGMVIPEGQSWQDGCSTCVCENAMLGIARCYEQCSKVAVLPKNCKRIPENNGCCEKISCPKDVLSGSNIGNLTNGADLIHNSTHGIVAKDIDGCLYKGHYYQEKSIWNDGCQFQCVCLNGSSGLYECHQRCPIFEKIPEDCTMVDFPGEACCVIPECNSTHVLVPKYGKPKKGVEKPTSEDKGGCVYTDGKRYKKGQTWLDGCEYSCVCTNEETGAYICEKRCPYLGSPPAGCRVVRDEDHDCCNKFECLKPTSTPHVTTDGHVPGKCFYKGRSYAEGQQWNDACSKSCVCENGKYGYYRCQDRCASFSHLPQKCVFQPDPLDSQCCKFPQCGDNTTLPTGIKGTKKGFGKSHVPSTIYKGVCLYKSKVYKQGDTWNDGCDYSCECIDASKNEFRCTSRCNRYNDIPSNCREVNSTTDQCCTTVECTPLQPTCKDHISNCQSYGKVVCSNPTFADWALDNCPNYCNLCGVTRPTQPYYSTTPVLVGSCMDQVNCSKFSFNPCDANLRSWAAIQCPVHCNLCVPFTGSTPDPYPNCVDKKKCETYKIDVCHGSLFKWGLQNCQRFCHLCDRKVPAIYEGIAEHGSE
ncbi:uncharacterized protein LOC115210527 [Argonauta hians]